MDRAARQLADEAARRGWRYPFPPNELGLADRWEWGVEFDHPFHRRGPTRYDQARDALAGVSTHGRPFWAFSYTYVALKGAPPSAFRDVAFVHTGIPLPTVSVVSRAQHVGSRRVGMFGPLVGRLERRAAQAGTPRAGAGSDMAVRLDGWPVGSDELRRHYKVEADDRPAAEWLVQPAVEYALLADPGVSLASNGADLLAWCDRGYLSIAVVDALVAVLDAVGLPATP